MTAAAQRPPAPGPDTPAGGGDRVRRRHRLVIPYAVLLAVVSVTWLAHHLEEPDLRDPATLAPAGTGPDGASRLAGLLAGRGVDIVHVTGYEQARDELAAAEDAVVFIPKPTVMGAALAWEATTLAEVRRVVMVAPNRLELAMTGAPITPGQRRWAASAEAPACQVPEAVAAGRAAALRSRYAAVGGQTCYAGGLARTRLSGTDLMVVGATDPFRNRRIDEHGNATLAVELLSTRDRVIWLDAIPTDANLDLRFPELRVPDRPERDRTPGNRFGWLVYAYPPGVLAALGLAALLAVLTALARARRLGGPVSEPLPVLVPAAEAVTGRGRLYQRARQRAATLETLRGAARRRLAPPAGGTTPDAGTLVAAVAARSGLPAEHVRRTLYGPAPETDDDLANAVTQLDQLVAAAIDNRGGAT